MELKIAANKLEQVTRQRNLFILLAIVIMAANLILAGLLAGKEERIIMVPGISTELSITGGKVSRSYLEESSLLFLSALLDLTPDTVKHKRDMVLKYSSSRSQKELQKIRNYFSQAELEHNKFNMSTYFTPNKLELNVKDLEVIASGILSSNFGKQGWESKSVKYYLSFEFAGGHLKLKEFYQLVENTQDNKVK